MLISPLSLIFTSEFFWYFIHVDEAKGAKNHVYKQKNNKLAAILE